MANYERTSQMPRPPKGYAHAGHLNGMSNEAEKQISRQWGQCLDDHSDECVSHDSSYGGHIRWCQQCQYSWGYDSSG